MYKIEYRLPNSKNWESAADKDQSDLGDAKYILARLKALHPLTVFRIIKFEVIDD